MNKTELIDAIAKDSGLSKADSSRALESLLTTVTKTLKKGDEVAITGFGKFSVAKRGARTGRNPQTGAPVKIKASKNAKFTAGATLKNAVAGRRAASKQPTHGTRRIRWGETSVSAARASRPGRRPCLGFRLRLAELVVGGEAGLVLGRVDGAQGRPAGLEYR